MPGMRMRPSSPACVVVAVVAVASTAAGVPAAPGATSSAIGGNVAVRGTAPRTSHHSMRGAAMLSAPARAGTIENLRVSVVRGRPSSKVSSDCNGSGNTCAAPPASSTSSGNCEATAPSATASTVTVVASPARTRPGIVE